MRLKLQTRLSRTPYYLLLIIIKNQKLPYEIQKKPLENCVC